MSDSPAVPESSPSRFVERVARLALSVVRVALPMWLGGAILFVWAGVREVRNTNFDSVIRDHLVLTRFPAFYFFGGSLLLVSIIGLVAWGWLQPRYRFRWRVLLVGMLAAGGLMLADYFTIYLPLTELITPPGKPRTEAFSFYHQASLAINFAGLIVCCGLTVIVHLPVRNRKE